MIDSGQVKPSKKGKKNKPSQDPVVTGPVLDSSIPDSSAPQSPPEPASNIPKPTSNAPAEDIIHNSDDPEVPSPDKTVDPGVEIVKS